jgi:hypothetical protein
MLKKQGMFSFEVFSIGIVPVSLRQVQAVFPMAAFLDKPRAVHLESTFVTRA